MGIGEQQRRVLRRIVRMEAVTSKGSIGKSQEAESLVRALLTWMGEDPDRAGLRDTSGRVSRSLAELTRGYTQDPQEVLGSAIFEEPYDEMVVLKNIELYSLCEHHLLPFYGKAHVAYLPAGRIVGLSKIPRLVDIYARRLQVQERLTVQIAEALNQLLVPQGVGVVIEVLHLCL